jgi:hypothetical protein
MNILQIPINFLNKEFELYIPNYTTLRSLVAVLGALHTHHTLYEIYSFFNNSFNNSENGDAQIQVEQERDNLPY